MLSIHPNVRRLKVCYKIQDTSKTHELIDFDNQTYFEENASDRNKHLTFNL